jgi:hypothetical protein
MRKGIVLVVVLMGIALGIGWYGTAQDSWSLQQLPAAEDECPPYELEFICPPLPLHPFPAAEKECPPYECP